MPAFRIDASTGALSSFPGSPFNDGNQFNPDGIAIHPTGRFLYANTVSGLVTFSIDPTTGALTSIGQVAPYVLRHLAVDASGKLLVGSPLNGGGIEVFKIDHSSCVLSVIGPPFVGTGGGQGPITIIKFP
jgi:6-phosphogluconolactonase (cycloisomerase 2 family)